MSDSRTTNHQLQVTKNAVILVAGDRRSFLSSRGRYRELYFNALIVSKALCCHLTSIIEKQLPHTDVCNLDILVEWIRVNVMTYG